MRSALMHPPQLNPLKGNNKIMQKKLTSLLLCSTVFTVACQQPSNVAAPTIDKSEAVVSVNGKFVSKTLFEKAKSEAQQGNRGQAIPDEQLLQKIVDMELLVQDAEAKKLDQDPEVQQKLTMMKKGILSQTAVQDYLKSNPVTDAELQAEYDKQISTSGDAEYKARHILVKSEDEAKAIIVELDQGGDFVAIAKEKSVGPSKTQGGDLGWFAPARMVPPFSEAVIALENGKYTAIPVKTQFGWHVILREDSRAMTPPAFDAVKERLRPMLQRQKIQDYLTTLRSQAKIESYLQAEPIKPAAITPKVSDSLAQPQAQTPTTTPTESTPPAQ